jgi:hypothetical protein
MLREMDDDIVMVDPDEAQMDPERATTPPVPPEHRSSNIEESHEAGSGGVKIQIQRSGSPEKTARRQHSLQPVYPNVTTEIETAVGSGDLPKDPTQGWREKWIKEKKSKEMYEDLWHARTDELEALRRETFAFASSDLQTELDTERRLRAQLESDLTQRSIEVEETRKRWKQAAKQLNLARSQSQGFYQVTDQYLIDLTNQLRYDIRGFAIQFFEGEIRKKPKWQSTDYWDYILLATGYSTVHDNYLLSNDRCPSLIQAFIWKFLFGRVFEHFRWLDPKVMGHPFWDLCRVLRPSE